MTQKLEFTAQCTGDLGITVNGRVVAMLFIRRGNSSNVFDLVLGGEPKEFVNQDEALNQMLKIAFREAEQGERK